MTAHTPVTDAPPGGLWRAAALAWLLVVIAVGVHQWQFWTHDGIDTDVTEDPLTKLRHSACSAATHVARSAAVSTVKVMCVPAVS